MLDLRLRALFLGACLLPSLAAAQDGALDPTLLAGLRARSIGPAGMSGRIAAVDALASDPNQLWVGAATGGVWKSENGGLSFEPLFDDRAVASIGALTIFQQSPEIVWVGTGEGNLRNSASVGNGVYRTVDGGASWSYLGLAETEHVHRIVVHPTDPDTAWVAALGRAWGENHQRGVFKTVDGGQTWEHVLFVDERTGCADLVSDPSNPLKLFAAMWDYRREPYFFRSGGPGSGLHVTRDGGSTWERLDSDDGLPEGDLGRIGLAVAPSSPNVVYALTEAKQNALCKSTDGGKTWSIVNSGEGVAVRPFYYADIYVDPQDPERVYNLQSVVKVSSDGGQSFETLIPWSKIHPDHHAWWMNPHNPAQLVNGSDGGLAISHDHGASWRFVPNLPLAQFYHVTVDDAVPYNILGGMQDNGSWRGPSEVWENAGIRNHHWREVGFGDGFDTVAIAGDERRGYSMSQAGYLMRWDAETGERKNIRPPAPLAPREVPPAPPAPPADGDTDADADADADTGADDGTSDELAEVELRFNWNSALLVDPLRPDTLYYGSQFVHRSDDRGDTWTIISPDLTSDNPEWQRQSETGGLTIDDTGAENYTTIVSLAASPIEDGCLWAATDDGRLHVTRDAGGSWNSVEENLPDWPANAWLPHVEASQHVRGRAYVTSDDHRRSNWTPYLFVTEDHGASWRNIAPGPKPGAEPGEGGSIVGYAHAVEEDPVDPNLLFLGTELGLWISVDRGANWLRFEHGLPTVSVRDLVVHPREHDLVVATHGRAAYVIDDISALRGLTPARLEAPLTLFGASDGIQHRSRQVDGTRFAGDASFSGHNPAYGVAITFALSGEDLEHPDEQIERQRAAARKAREEAEQEAEEALAAEDNEGEGDDEDEEDEEPADEDGDKLEITILDRAGEVVRELEPDVQLGLNRVAWDLRGMAWKRPSFESDEDDDEPRGSGAFVVPGTYTVRVSYRDASAETTCAVLPDPRSTYVEADRLASAATQARVGAIFETVDAVCDRWRDVDRDLAIVQARVERALEDVEDAEPVEGEPVEGQPGEDSGQDPAPPTPLEALETALKDYRKQLDELRDAFRDEPEVQGIADSSGFLDDIWGVVGPLGSSFDAPNATTLELLERRERELAALAARANELFGPQLDALREQWRTAELGFLEPAEPIE